MKIAQINPSTSWGDISYEALQRGIGGREGACIRLAVEWAKLGHEVTNFVPIKNANRIYSFDLTDWKLRGSKEPSRAEMDSGPPIFRPEIGFTEFVPVNLAKPMLASFPYDAVVSWEHPDVFASEAVMEKQKVRLIHMQVAHLEDNGMAQYSTGIVALSEWAKNFLQHQGVEAPNWYVRPNGVNIEDYPFDKAMKKRKGVNIVYSSSPDRGLLHLLKMWPEIRKRCGNKSRLFVAYGVNRYTDTIRWAHSKIGEMSVEIEMLMQQPGVIDVGKIGQKQLANLQMQANMWVYPADTIQATETGCITAIENMAAGNICLISDADCLEDEFGKGFVGGKDKICEYPPPAFVFPLPISQDKWLGAIEAASRNSDELLIRRSAARAFAESRDWAAIAPTWIDLFKENANAQT